MHTKRSFLFLCQTPSPSPIHASLSVFALPPPQDQEPRQHISIMQRAQGSNPGMGESSVGKSSHNNAPTLHYMRGIFSTSRPFFGSGVGSGVPSTITPTSSNGPLLSRQTLDAPSTITSSRTSNANGHASSFFARNPEFTANNSSRIASTMPENAQSSSRNSVSEDSPRKYLRTLSTMQPAVGLRPLGLTKVLPINKTPTKPLPSTSTNYPPRPSATTKPFTPVVRPEPIATTPNNTGSTPLDTHGALFGDILNGHAHGSGDSSSNLKETNDQLRKSVGSSALDFARKSLMHHATTAPQEAIRRVTRVAADSHGAPSITDLMTAPDVDVEDPEAMARDEHRQSFARPDEQFTFESTPLPAQETENVRQEISHSHGILDLSQPEPRSRSRNSFLSPVNETQNNPTPSTSAGVSSASRFSASRNGITPTEVSAHTISVVTVVLRKSDSRKLIPSNILDDNRMHTLQHLLRVQVGHRTLLIKFSASMSGSHYALAGT